MKSKKFDEILKEKCTKRSYTQYSFWKRNSHKSYDVFMNVRYQILILIIIISIENSCGNYIAKRSK